MFRHLGVVARRGVVDDLDDALVVGVVVPFRAQRDDLRVETRRGASRRADDHRLAGPVDERRHQFAPPLPVAHDVRGQLLETFVGAVDRVELGDALLQPRLVGVVEPGGDLLGAFVDVFVAEAVDALYLDEALLERDRHGRAVLDGSQQVVDVDVVAEHAPRVALTFGDGGTGERDERRVRQRHLEVTCVPVEGVVVAAVRLVGHDDDVAPIRQQRMVGARFAFALGEAELLQRREVNAARQLFAEQAPQLVARGHLLRFLRQQGAHPEPVEELGVEFLTVGDDDDRRVREALMAHHLGRVELHLHRLAGALRVPDDAGAAVTVDGVDGGRDGFRHGEVLVGFGDALAEAFFGLIERDEVAHDLPEPVDVEQARQREVEFGRRLTVEVGLAELHEVALFVDVPRREVVVRRPRRTVLRADAVARDNERAEPERHRKLAQVRLQLVVGALHRRVLRGGLLEFDDDERQAVDVEDDVEATLALTAADGHLLHREVGVL